MESESNYPSQELGVISSPYIWFVTTLFLVTVLHTLHKLVGIIMGGSVRKQEFRRAILELVSSNQVSHVILVDVFVWLFKCAGAEALYKMKIREGVCFIFWSCFPCFHACDEAVIAFYIILIIQVVVIKILCPSFSSCSLAACPRDGGGFFLFIWQNLVVLGH